MGNDRGRASSVGGSTISELSPRRWNERPFGRRKGPCTWTGFADFWL